MLLENAKDSRAAALAAELERSVKQNDDEAWWPATRDQMLDFEGDVTPEATAYAMKFLTRERKDSALLPKAALWLVNHRNEGYWWSSSKQTAMVIYGLVDYLKSTNELNPDFTAAVSVNGQAVGTQTFHANSPTQAPEIFLAESKLQPGANQITLTMKGTGKLYYSVSWGSLFKPGAPGTARGSLAEYSSRLLPAGSRKGAEITSYTIFPL